MNDHSELERLAEAATPGPWSYDGSYVCPARVEDGTIYVETWRSVADCAQPENTRFIAAANPSAVLAMIAENAANKERADAEQEAFDAQRRILEAVKRERDQLKAENEALRSKLTTLHFVCDQLPGPDGCRFIELENPQGESLGDESGKWEIRPDGLAQLVVEIASPDVKHMAALLECAQGDLKQAMRIIEKESKPLDDLIAENEVLCSKIASLNVSGFGEAFYQVAERLGITGARPASPMQVFTSEVLPALDRVIKDAERFRFIEQDADSGMRRIYGDDWLAKIDNAGCLDTSESPLPPNCWEVVVPKGTEAPCRTCSGFGTIQTGVDEAPSTICNACDGTGKWVSP